MTHSHQRRGPKDAQTAPDGILQRLQDMDRALRKILEERDRDAIGQAQGILIERYSVSAEEARALLLFSSSKTNLTPGETAVRLIRTGHL